MIVLVLLSFSCDRMIEDFELKNKPEKLVLNALLTPDSSLKVNLSSSLMANERISSLPYIDDATISVYEDGVLLDSPIYRGNGNYLIENIHPKVGHSYTIYANTNDADEVFSSVTIPEKPVILSVDTSFMRDIPEVGCLGCENNNYIDLTVKFRDKPDENNYYKIEVKYYHTYKQCTRDTVIIDAMESPVFYCLEADTTTRFETLYITSNNSFIDFYRYGDDFYLSNISYSSDGKALYFSDKLFTSADNQVTIQINSYEASAISGYKCYVYLYTIDENLYQFYHSLARWNEIDGNPLAEKVTLYTNVQNGLGVFSAHNSESYTVSLDSSWLYDPYAPEPYPYYYK